MDRFANRRIRHLFAATLGAAGLVLWVRWMDASLYRGALATGYVLYAAVLFLAAYHLRKKLPGIPLGRSATWMQIHLLVGAMTAPLFVLHTGGFAADGWLEGALAASYWATFLSGVAGLWLTRSLPRQLARTGEQYVYERIPQLRRRVLEDADTAVLAAVDSSGATTLASFYAERVQGFLLGGRPLAYAVRPTSSTRKRLFGEITALGRVLTPPEQEASEKLFALVRKKDDLDFHQSRQGLLKGWIFVHLCLTWSLLLLGALHGVLALGFSGGHA
ncbi:hypothetical protein Mal64_30110 [Pseudobythopirellula maris]|uniref:Ferric reductase like transmembrane component n=1 Tax=Pseudobythopirellula maris TaxID=2527991 RepID=A0A5C5ZJB2_9BACT|nr:hypothetical protein [Pseudobythopirellula maris]TWT87472.1 hypothetical protein Mal64_30110 [Pseudobythopirellula maris]